MDAKLLSKNNTKCKREVQDWKQSTVTFHGNELKLLYGITVKMLDGQCKVFKYSRAEGPAGIVHDNLLIYSSKDQQKKTIYKIHLGNKMATFKANVCPGIDDVVTGW
jgi:hypothetical protein